MRNSRSWQTRTRHSDSSLIEQYAWKLAYFFISYALHHEWHPIARWGVVPLELRGHELVPRYATLGYGPVGAAIATRESSSTVSTRGDPHEFFKAHKPSANCRIELGFRAGTCRWRNFSGGRSCCEFEFDAVSLGD